MIGYTRQPIEITALVLILEKSSDEEALDKITVADKLVDNNLHIFLNS